MSPVPSLSPHRCHICQQPIDGTDHRRSADDLPVCAQCRKRLSSGGNGGRPIRRSGGRAFRRQQTAHEAGISLGPFGKYLGGGLWLGIVGRLAALWSCDLAIDLGTANTLVYMKGRGIVLNEPSVVAIHTDRGGEKRILAVGLDAKKMLGRTPGYISAIRPVRDGVIADFDAAQSMLRHFIRKALKGRRKLRRRPRVIVAVPSGITQVEKRAVMESAERAGAREVYLIEEPMAAAIGADLPITEPRCSMVVDVGGGTTEVAVISLAGIVCSKSLRIAGDKMDAAIIVHIKRKYNLLIGESTAETIKMAIGNAQPDGDGPRTVDVRGSDLITGIPRVISVDYDDIREAITEQVEAIADAVRYVLERTPPELAGDIVNTGIVLTGGVALLKNLDRLLEERNGLPINVCDDPLSTVALGSGKSLDNIPFLKRVMLR